MMLVLALALQMIGMPEQETDIVVIGKRLEGVSVIVGRDARGKFACALDKSSGNSRLDMALCQTAAKCVKAKAANVPACVNARKPELLADVRQSLGQRR